MSLCSEWKWWEWWELTDEWGQIAKEAWPMVIFRVLNHTTVAATQYAQRVANDPGHSKHAQHQGIIFRMLEQRHQKKAGSGHYCEFCQQESSVRAGRPHNYFTTGNSGDQAERVSCKKVHFANCYCKDPRACHTQCASTLIGSTMYTQNGQKSCPLCDTCTVRTCFVCSSACSGSTLRCWCVPECMKIHSHWASNALFCQHLPVVLQPCTETFVGTNRAGVAALQVQEWLGNGYLELRRSENNGEMHCTSPFVPNDGGVTLQREEAAAAANSACASACKRQWQQLLTVPALSEVHALQEVKNAVENAWTGCKEGMEIPSSPCVPTRPCPRCNKYLASTLKPCAMSGSDPALCMWCNRGDNASCVVQCEHCGMKQHEQCVLGALATTRTIGPQCAKCGFAGFRKTRELLLHEPAPEVSAFHPHTLFLMQFKWLTRLSVPPNMMYPLGVMYAAKMGAFQQKKTQCCPQHCVDMPLVRKSVAAHWDTLAAVYRTLLSECAWQVATHMILAGEYMLSSIEGCEHVTKTIARNVQATRWTMQQSLQPWSVVVAETLQPMVLHADCTADEADALLQCFCMCHTVTLNDVPCDVVRARFTNERSDNVGDVQQPPLQLCTETVCSAAVQLELCLRNGTNRKRKHATHGGDTTRDVLAVQPRTDWNETELQPLKLVYAASQLDKQQRDESTLARGVMERCRSGEPSYALAALYCERQLTRPDGPLHKTPQMCTYKNLWYKEAFESLHRRTHNPEHQGDTAAQRTTSYVTLKHTRHHDMHASKGCFVKALTHMPEERAQQCVNAACAEDIVQIVVFLLKGNVRGQELPMCQVRVLTSHDIAEDSSEDTRRYRVVLRTRSEFACGMDKSVVVEEDVARNLSGTQLGLLCCVRERCDVAPPESMLAHFGHDTDAALLPPTKRLFNMLIDMWIRHMVALFKDEGSPPRDAIHFPYRAEQ